MPITAGTLKNDRRLRRMTGAWTAATGDASFTQAVTGEVYAAYFEDEDTGQQNQTQVSISVTRSDTTGISTVTVYPQSAVTRGRFVILYR